jgi:hypothetical protein
MSNFYEQETDGYGDEMPHLPFAVIMIIIIMIIITVSAICFAPTKEQKQELLKIKQNEHSRF